MDQALGSHLDHVDAALKTLVDSIASYNANPTAAWELIGANDGLNEELRHLATHQSNYARLQALRQANDLFDARIKEGLSMLNETRKELLATKVTTPSDAAQHVSLQGVLAYARRISKFTVPPTYRSSLPGERPEGDYGMQNPQEADKMPPQDGERPGVGLSALSAAQRDWLNSASRIDFVPWPSDEIIRRGCLAHIQTMLEQGLDPAVSDKTAKAEVTEEGPGISESPSQPQSERPDILAGQPLAPKEKPSIFKGLELYDPED